MTNRIFPSWKQSALVPLFLPARYRTSIIVDIGFLTSQVGTLRIASLGNFSSVTLSYFYYDCRFSVILLPVQDCNTSEGRVASQEQRYARQKCSVVYNFSTEQPELIIFILFSFSLVDSYGNIEPALEPVWALAVAGSSYIMWEKSTENLGYFMAQVKSVKQWVSKVETTRLRYRS